MLKFFRKYQKIILVVGGCLLMIVFLLPQLPQMLGGGRNRVVAELDGQKIKAKEWTQASREIQILASVSPALASFIAGDAHLVEDGRQTSVGLWLMRQHEAEELGLIGGPRDGRGFLDEGATILGQVQGQQLYRQALFSGQMSQDITVDQFIDAATQEIRQRLEYGRSSVVRTYGEDIVDRTLAKARGIIRLFNLYGQTGMLSIPEARTYGQTLFDKAFADVLVIPASSEGAQPQDFTAQQVEAHFEEYKNVDPATTEFGIGYLRKPAARVEYLKIDKSSIQDQIEPDEIALRRMHLQSEGTYDPDFQKARRRVLQDYKRQEAERILEAVVKRLRTRIVQSEAPLEKNGLVAEIPDTNWRGVTLAELADEAQNFLEQEFSVTGVRPQIYAAGETFHDAEGLNALSGIGRAMLQTGGGRGGQVRFAQIVLNAMGFEDRAFPRMVVQEDRLFGPIQDAFGSRFFFRITDIRPESPPDSVAEVEQQIRRDLAMLDGYERLAAQTDEIRERVIAEGIDSVASGIEGTQQAKDFEIRANWVFAQGAGDLNQTLNTEALRDAVMNRIRAWDPVQEVSELPEADRVMVMPVPQAQGLVVLHINRREPMTLEDYRTGRQSIRRLYMQDAFEGVDESAFSESQMAQRLNFEEKDLGESQEDLEEEAARLEAEKEAAENAAE
ncbi:MAG: hypothetical protein RIB32_02685 [Phycisphaerales bacterium]